MRRWKRDGDDWFDGKNDEIMMKSILCCIVHTPLESNQRKHENPKKEIKRRESCEMVKMMRNWR